MSETILELERRLEFILQELQKVEEIECPSLKQVTRNYLLTLYRRTLTLIIDAKSFSSLIEWSQPSDHINLKEAKGVTKGS